MKKPALIIKNLSIYKMPGFPTGMKSISSLASDINVIAGPNASGKSSTARIIQDMIWKKNIERIHLESRLSIDENIWDIKIDNGHYSSQCNGVDDTLSSIPAYDESKRYFLALHELIREDDNNLAAEILRETIGGYNLQEAYQILEYRATTPSLGLSEYKEYEAKRKHVDNIKTKQKNLQKEEQRLTALQEKYEEAKHASKLKQLYERFIDFLKAKNNYEILESEKSSYPEQMELLIGTENEEISKLEQRIEKTTQEINAICRKKESQEEELSALQIPEGGFGKKVLDELSENVDKLSNWERNLESRRIEIAKNKSETKVVLSNLFSTLKSEDLEALDLENVRDLDSFFEEAHRLLHKRQQLENEIKRLNKEKEEQTHTETDLNLAIRHLLNWFEKDATPSSSSRWQLWALLIIGLITVPLTYLYGWTIGLIGVFAMLLFVLFKGRDAEPDNSIQETRVNDFKKTGIPEPASWQEEEVSKRLEELHQELHEVKQQNEINRRLTELNGLLEQIEPQFQTLEAKRETWIDKLSNIPELSVENIESYSGLYWFLKNLQKWQKYNNELQANLLSYEEENKIYTETLAHINSILNEVDVKPASDVASAKAFLRKMNEDENRRSTLLSDSKHLDEQKLVYDASKTKDREELHSIYSRLNLEVGAKEELRMLLSKKESYDDFEKEFEQAKRRLTEKENQLQDHLLYTDKKEELLTLPCEEAEEQKEKYTKLSNETEALYTEIAKIEAHVNKERTGHELEVALTEREAALNNLEQNYLNTMTLITGDVIVNGLKKKTQEHSSSKVLNRANELFNKITHGHYELILDDSVGASFRAKDTILNQGQPLDHLSSGTRIQLLIAVRLAFIESQESGVKLPILADEVLANSDDLRATQIIEALIEISKEGRQVFYFTAQADELKKWQEHLARHPDIDGQIVVLKGQANEQIVYSLGELPETPSLQFAEVPSPNGYSNEEYHQLLSPQQYHLLKDTPEQLYLSYIIEDNELLYACLQRGIQYYGQLKSYVKFQGKVKGLNEFTLKVIDNKVELLNFYQELYQKGRAKPIDRAVLLDSDCVSDRFIDLVDAKLKEVDHNPKRLIEALWAREVSGFMSLKIEELEGYLFEKNYIDENDQLTLEELNMQLHAKLSNMESLPVLEAKRFLERVMASQGKNL
ncbi:MAG: hypothetical protein PHN55_11495 [Dysgonamonadaceae bacterium]|nr:hypothetical protein [Dysgonamonadaceae bacterium]